MSREQLAKWRQAEPKQLLQELNELAKARFKLNLQKKLGGDVAGHKLKEMRRDIARLLTILTEKEGKK